jgi:DNA-binding response OmpR family regulator
VSRGRILICDDNATVHQTLLLYLQEAGFDVLSAYDGAAALDIIQNQQIDLLILDIMLPKMFGTEVCKQVRKISGLPIIMLSAKSDEADRIAGLELGADDYITKPFSPREVVVRVRTVLRRAALSSKEIPFLVLGNLVVNPKSYEVQINGRPVHLTPREVELLTYMMEHAGEVVSREDILNSVWGYDYYGDMRTVDTLMGKLRAKVSEKNARVSFKSIYGVGYMLEVRDEK